MPDSPSWAHGRHGRSDRDGVEVTGAVPDVRPYLAHARLAVAPMRIARGLQNKVLEALSMSLPVVLTPQAAAGLQAGTDVACDVAETSAAFADAVITRLTSAPEDNVRHAARAYVLRHYAWATRSDELDRLLTVPGSSQEPGTGARS